MRYKCTVTYNGSAYAGSQRQKNANTIQNEIEHALKRIYNQSTTIHLSSRTDKGVHALMQVFHYDVDIKIALSKLPLVINRQLPKDIKIISAETVSTDFHARYSTLQKTYSYKINTGGYNIFAYNTVYQYNKTLDIAALNEFAKNFIGEHDFGAFMAAGSDKQNTIRTIYHIEFSSEKNIVTMTITGNGFLYHMVRIMVGMFLDFAEQKKDADSILENFKLKNRAFFKRTAPACGLYLKEIIYT